MSKEAEYWAYRQETPGPALQIVLLLLAAIANENGDIQFISLEYLWPKARQSRASTYRRLNELEELQLLSRYKKFVNRRAIISGKLHLDRVLRDRTEEGADLAQEALESAAYDELGAVPCHDPKRANSGKPEETDESQIEKGHPEEASEGSTNLKLRLEESHSSETRGISLLRLHKENLFIESNTTTTTSRESAVLKQIVVVEEADREFQKKRDADFERFTANYPMDPTMDRDAAKHALGLLTLADRDIAIRRAAIYAQALVARNKKFALDAVNWIRKRKFDEIGETRQEQAEKVGLDKYPDVFVACPSPAFDAWNAHARRHGKVGYPRSAHKDGQKGWYFPTLYPPKEAPAAPPAGEVEM